MRLPPLDERRVFRTYLLVGIAAVVVPVGLFFYYFHRNARDNAARVQAILDEATAGATVLRIWGAGVRTASGFCSCARVPKPERVFYETKDPAEIREFGSLLRARSYLELDPLCACCGQITIDFLRGEEILLSIHPHGELRSTRGTLPVSAETHDRVEQWLSRRSVRENLEQALKPR